MNGKFTKVLLQCTNQEAAVQVFLQLLSILYELTCICHILNAINSNMHSHCLIKVAEGKMTILKRSKLLDD